MININKKNLYKDAIAEARKDLDFVQYQESAAIRIRLGIEMYKMREQQNISQQELAKRAKTTQKVISNVENGDVNVGLDSLNRIGQSLGFSAENWGKVFNFTPVTQYVLQTSTENATSNTLISTTKNHLTYNHSSK